MEYGVVIKAAFRFARANPRLWPFGVLAGTGGGGFSFSYDGGGGGDDSSFHIDPTVLIAVVAVVLVAAIVAFLVSVLSQGALAEAVPAVQRGEHRGFRRALRAGRASFWRVLGLIFLVGALVVAGLVAVLAVAGGAVALAFLATHSLPLRILSVLVAVLLGLATVFLGFFPLLLIHQHALRGAVLSGRRPVAALRGGWATLRADPGPSILVFLIQQGLALAGYTAVGLATVLLSVPAIIVMIATGAGSAGVVIAGLTAVVVVPAAVCAAGAVGTFAHALWTTAYLRLTPTGERPA